MSKPSAKVVADSSYNGKRLITLEIELHRFILPEVNTHKAVSRNYQSSRAIPVLRQLQQIIENPAMPVYYGKNQSGMQAGEELTGEELELAKKTILLMRDACVEGVKFLHKLGLAKQTANRYVEPWMWTRGVVTATEEAWEDIFRLRIHPAAQPEFKVLCEEIKGAIVNSESVELLKGEAHTPYFENGYWTPDCGTTLKEAVMISASCVAQVSYRKLDDSLEKAVNVYGMLNLPVNGKKPDEPEHYSPTEHIAIANNFKRDYLSGNFHNTDFVQYRKLLEEGREGAWIGGNV